MQRSTPFARAHAMMAAIAAAMAMTGPGKEFALSAIAPYKSRGKGRGNGSASKNYFKSRSKYMPHIGAKESAKAVKRMEASQQQFKQAA
jgi:hypothetical protein